MRPMRNIKTQADESGIVAILVVIVFTSVMALISIGFSQLMSREERQSLDRQLSLQAYYSSESGLNDARNYLSNPAAKPMPNGCTAPTDISPSPFVTGGNLSGDAAATVKYSCLNIDTSPKELIYELDPGQSKIVKLDVPGMDKIYLSWENQSAPSSAGRKPLGTFSGTTGSLPREDQIPGGADATGLLRTGFYPITKGTGQINNANTVLANASRTYFMYPDSGAGAGTMNANNQVDFTNAASSATGRFVHGNCSDVTHPNLPYNNNTPRYCNSAIYDLNGTNNTYTLYLAAFYEPIRLSIQVSGGGSPLQVPGTEAVIDITGAGNDVLSRVQARFPLNEDTNPVAYGIQSMQAICKVFRTDVIGSNTYGNSNNDPSVYNGDFTCNEPPSYGAAIVGGGIPPLGNIPCGTNAVGSYPFCSCPAGYTPNPDPFTDCKKIVLPPPNPSINVWSYNGGNSFTYNVNNASYCEVHVDNPAGGVQGFGPINGVNFSVTAGNGGGGVLWCWDGSSGPVQSGHAP